MKIPKVKSVRFFVFVLLRLGNFEFPIKKKKKKTSRRTRRKIEVLKAKGKTNGILVKMELSAEMYN